MSATLWNISLMELIVICQVISWESHLQNYLYCVEWYVKLSCLSPASWMSNHGQLRVAVTFADCLDFAVRNVIWLHSEYLTVVYV